MAEEAGAVVEASMQQQDGGEPTQEAAQPDTAAAAGEPSEPAPTETAAVNANEDPSTALEPNLAAEVAPPEAHVEPQQGHVDPVIQEPIPSAVEQPETGPAHAESSFKEPPPPSPPQHMDMAAAPDIGSSQSSELAKEVAPVPPPVTEEQNTTSLQAQAPEAPSDHGHMQEEQNQQKDTSPDQAEQLAPEESTGNPFVSPDAQDADQWHLPSIGSSKSPRKNASKYSVSPKRTRPDYLR